MNVREGRNELGHSPLSTPQKLLGHYLEMYCCRVQCRQFVNIQGRKRHLPHFQCLGILVLTPNMFHPIPIFQRLPCVSNCARQQLHGNVGSRRRLWAQHYGGGSGWLNAQWWWHRAREEGYDRCDQSRVCHCQIKSKLSRWKIYDTVKHSILIGR